MGYLTFIGANRRLLAFGFSLAFFASFGQTYFIALFSAELREAFALSQGGFGTVYALATLTSAVLMTQIGPLFDRTDLRLYSAVICAGMAGAAVVLGIVPPASVVFLYLAILLLRLFGQGLMSHAALTAMMRYFDDARGKAIAVASLGFPAGEACFPLLAVTATAVLGWRQTWWAIAAVLAVLVVPLVLWLLRGQAGRRDRHLARMTDSRELSARDWSRREVLRDPFFYLVLPAFLAPSFINTGVFFIQVALVEAKGWSLSLFAAGFTVYAIATLLSVLTMGPLLDRLGAASLFRWILLPLAGGLLVLGTSAAPVAVFAFMIAAGLTTGAQNTAATALWAEVYGVGHLGAIQALTASLAVLASALAPAVLGLMIDAGISVDTLLLLCMGLAILVWLPIPFADRVRVRSARTRRAR